MSSSANSAGKCCLERKLIRSTLVWLHRTACAKIVPEPASLDTVAYTESDKPLHRKICSLVTRDYVCVHVYVCVCVHVCVSVLLNFGQLVVKFLRTPHVSHGWWGFLVGHILYSLLWCSIPCGDSKNLLVVYGFLLCSPVFLFTLYKYLLTILYLCGPSNIVSSLFLID